MHRVKAPSSVEAVWTHSSNPTPRPQPLVAWPAVDTITGGINIGEIDHLAVVVRDLGDAMNLYSETLGLTWADPWTGEIPIIIGSERNAPTVSFTLSIEGPPHMELIQSTDETVWRTGPGLHHFGVWVDDVDAAIQVTAGKGFAVEVMSPDSGFAYLRSSDGARIELVNSRSQPDFARWLSGGHL
jgi:catechol 2,3-dioxygenase-like lactoylglutathione lyase family enzyme